MNYIISVIFGVLALIISILKFQCKTKKLFLIYNALDCFCFGMQFLLLDQYSGALMSFLGTFGSLFALVFHKTLSTAIKITYIGCITVILYIFVPDAFSEIWKFLPVIGLLICRVAEIQKSNLHMRYMFIPSSLLWLLYGMFTQAWPSVVAELLGILSNISSIMKIKKTSTNQQNIV